MANNNVETDSENIISLLLIDVNQPIELEWNLLATDENKVSNFTPGSLESKFLAETNTDEMKDVDNMFPQPAAVTLNKTKLDWENSRFHKSYFHRKTVTNQKFIFTLMPGGNKRSFILKQTCSF